jgi:hypothetical protein
MSRILSATLFLAACAVDAPDELSTIGQEIFGPDAVLATQSHANRAVAMMRATNPDNPGPYRVCTGTFIDDNHAITAAHCDMAVGDKVSFYTTPDNFDLGRMRTIVAVGIQSGVHPENGDYVNSNGVWADLAIVRLNATAGAPAVIAALDFLTPTEGELGAKVGAGGHPVDNNDDDGDGNATDNDGNSNGTLLRIGDTVDLPNNDGIFITSEDQVNHGDSGGAFYTAKNGVGLWLSGVLADWRTVDGEKRAGYTDIATHLDWILDVIDYSWAGGSMQNLFRTGTSITTLNATTRVCQYACQRTSACVAFNLNPTIDGCILLSSVSGSAALPGWVSDLKP